MFKDLKIMKSNNINTMKRGSRSLISSTLAMTVGSPSGFGSKSLLKLVSVLALIFTLGVGNVWGTTIASWGKISISASTDYKATGGDANNNNVAKFSSSKAINTGAGTNSYYGSGAGGAVITFSNLNLSTYTSIQMTFYSRASSGGSIMLSYSMDGSSWVDINSATVNGTESQKTITGIPYYATYLRLTHSASSGSLYFGTVVISGTAATMRTVTWNVNGSTTTAGSPTVSVPSGSKVGKLPTAPSSCDGSKVFVGWTATPIVGTTNTEPADLFGVYLDAPTVSANTDYYAVFATATPGSDTNREYSFLNSSAMSTSTSAGWSVSPTTASFDGTHGASWGRNSGAILPVFTFTPSKRISKITITVRQSNTTGSNTVSCSAGGTTINTLSMPNDKASHDLEFSPSFVSKGTIVIRCTNTSANSTGQGTFYVKTITLKEDATTYSAYATSCASCGADPTVTAASNNGSITSTSVSARCASGIDVIGSGCSLTSYGFAVGTSANPTIGGTLTGTGKTYQKGTSIAEDTEYTLTIDGLEPNTTYHIRPYATNGHGTGYGTEYTATTKTATPTFGTAAGTYNNDQSVTLSCTTTGAKIYYTTNGSTPSSSSTLYSGAISITSDNTTIKAIAYNSSTANPSEVASATYRLTCSAPSFDISGGTYNVAKDVAITSTTTSASIYYTTDGSTPTSGSTLYTGKVHIDADMTLKAIAIKSNYTSSSVASAEYEINLPRTVSFSTGAFNPTVDAISEESFESGIELPEGPEPYCSCDGWVFVGWSETEITNETTAPEMLPPGQTWKPDANCTLYAVYRKTTTGTSTATFAADDDGTYLDESSYWNNQWRHKGSGCEIWISDGQRYTGGTPYTWSVNYNSNVGDYYADIFAYRKIKKIEITLSGSNYKVNYAWSDNDPGGGSRATSLATDGTSQVLTCEGIVDGDVTNVALHPTTSYQLRMTTFTITYYNGKFTSNPHTSEYSFHWGTDGQSNWTATCFQQVDDGNEWIVEDYTIPSTTHFYVGYQGEAKTSGDLGSGGSSSATVAWSADPTKGGTSNWQGQMHLVPYNTTSNDIENWGVGLATGATGTINIYDNSGEKNLFVGFEPDGYGITFGGNSYAFGDATDHVRETEVVTLPASLSATYSVGLATATEGTYVDCSHSDNTATFSTMAVTDKVDGKIKVYLNPGVWDKDGAKFAVWDGTNSKFGISGEYLTLENGLYVGYVASNCLKINMVRLNSSAGDTPTWEKKDNQTNDITLTTLNTKVSITGWNEGDHSESSVNPTASAKGKFRMWDNNSYKNWCTHFIPYYVLTYNKNDEGASGTMASQERCGESSTLTVTVQANGFTAPTGKHFTGWKTGASSGDSYAADDSYTLTSNGTLYAQWAWDTYTITYNKGAYGTGSDIANGTKTYNVKYDISSSTYSRTGYTQKGWSTSDGGEKVYDFGAEYTTNAALNLYPYWEVNVTAITLDKNGGGANGEAVVAYDGDEILIDPHATAPTGYHLEGYYTNDATPVKIITAAGEFAADDITGYVTDGKWSLDEDEITLYAHWEISSYTLAWNKNADDADDLTGDYTTGSTNYNTALTAPNTPTRTGWTFDSWNTATDGSGDDYTGYMPAATTTYYAQWTINQYKMKVGAPAEVTITASVNASAKGEGSETDVDYGTTVTLNYSSLTSGHYWGGWKVTKTSDGTAVDVSGSGDGATFTMPAYGITITAIIYGNLKAWCDPQVTITGDIYLTSYKDIYVNSTSATSNLINISSSDLGSATSFDIIYLNGSDEVVAKGSSLFRLCNDGTSNYNMVDASSSTVDISASSELNQNYSIRYTPNVYAQLDNGKLQIVLKDGSHVLKTLTKELHGRSLPEEFVIAAKSSVDNQWYALPADMSTSSGTVPTPYLISVDNRTTPTAATYAPANAKFTGAVRYAATSNVGGIRIKSTTTQIDSKDAYVTAPNSADATYLYLATGATNFQDWYLTSSNFSSYTVQINPDVTNGRPLRINGRNIGYYTTGNTTMYILPVTNEITIREATATEWGQHSVVVAVNGSDVYGAKARVDNGDQTDKQTVTPINATKASAKNFKVSVGDIDLADLTNSEGKVLMIDWLDGSDDVLATSCISIPRIIAADRNMYKDGETTKGPWNTEVHVLPGATLTANPPVAAAPSGWGNNVTIKELHVYPGATINIANGTLTATTLRLHNGWTRAGTKDYNVARVYIADDAALVKTTASMDYDIYDSGEGKHYYPLAVPFQTAVSTIDYADSYLAGFSNYGASGQYVIKEYSGALRAENGPDQANNWTEVSSSANLTPGKGYIMTAVAVKGEAIIRVPLTFDNGWTADGEKASYGGSTKNVVAVSAYDGTAARAHDRHKGWNMLGVPFMSCYGAGTDMYSGGDASLINGELVVNTDADQNMEYQSTTIPYVSVPSHDFAEYVQTDITETKLLPGWSFFVQVDADGDLTFAVSNQRPNNDNPIYAPKRSAVDEVLRTGIILSDGEASDKTTILISDQYSGADYEIGADLEKMFGNGYTLATYSLSGSTRLAYNAMSKSDATAVIPIGYRAPAEGEYTYSLNPRYAEAKFERVDLIDYQTGSLTNLMTSSYTFMTGRTQDDSRFALNVVMKPTITTDVEAVSGERLEVNGVQKVIINDHMYIIRSGKMYDATGKCVKGGQK